jgi:hypothetical protein
MSYILKIKSGNHPFNNRTVPNPYWGDYSYIRIFDIKPKNITGWIVQIVKRITNVKDKNDKIYDTNKKIAKVTNKIITNSNEEYLELFRVIDGEVVDEDNIDTLVDDEFSSGAIKPYKEYKNEMMVSNDIEDDTTGYINMTSKAYLIESTVKVDGFIRKSFHSDISAANGLRSTYDVLFYNVLSQYKKSNTWCCDLKISWNYGNNGKNNLEILKEYATI